MYFRKMKHKQTELYISEPIESDSEGNALTIEDIISSNINVEQIAELKIDSERLYRFILEELDEREREIICKRYGVADVDGSVCRPMTQKEIAKKLGISRSYISKIELSCREVKCDVVFCSVNIHRHNYKISNILYPPNHPAA